MAGAVVRRIKGSHAKDVTEYYTLEQVKRNSELKKRVIPHAQGDVVGRANATRATAEVP